MSLLKPTEVDFEVVWNDQFGLAIDHLLSDNYNDQANIKGMYLYRYLLVFFLNFSNQYSTKPVLSVVYCPS